MTQESMVGMWAECAGSGETSASETPLSCSPVAPYVKLKSLAFPGSRKNQTGDPGLHVGPEEKCYLLIEHAHLPA